MGTAPDPVVFGSACIGEEVSSASASGEGIGIYFRSATSMRAHPGKQDRKGEVAAASSVVANPHNTKANGKNIGFAAMDRTSDVSIASDAEVIIRGTSVVPARPACSV